MTAPSYPPAQWRLIVDGAADGARNMSVDEAILGAVVEGRRPATLRLYAWSPPCLSLGRNQRLGDVDLEACRAAGIDVVRRPTGGKGILHVDELTYSVTLPPGDPRAAGDVVEGYRRLSEGLLAGLRRLGVAVVPADGEIRGRGQPGPVCFETPSNHEITAGGRKLVGSAQWRARGGVLQHGSLPLEGDITRIVEYLAFAEPERRAQRQALRARACTLEAALGLRVPFADAARSLAQGFAEALDLMLIPGALSPEEETQVDELRRARYITGEWTGHP
jgi:lipoate-protein ligase A